MNRKEINRELFRQFAAASSPAERMRIRNEIVVRNLAIVRFFSGNDDDDFQAGVMGMMRAVELYNPARGVTLMSYAKAWIRHFIAIERKKVPMGAIRLPVNIVQDQRQASAASAHLMYKRGEPPTTAEVAEFLCKPVAKVAKVMDLRPGLVSLDAPMPGEDGLSFIDATAGHDPLPDARCARRVRLRVLDGAINRLEGKTALIMRMLIAGHTRKAVAESIGISPQAVGQRRDNAVVQLRAFVAERS